MTHSDEMETRLKDKGIKTKCPLCHEEMERDFDNYKGQIKLYLECEPCRIFNKYDLGKL